MASRQTEQAAPGGRPTTGRGSLLIFGILLAIVLYAGAGYFFNDLRQDAEQRQAAIALTGGNPDNAASIVRRFGCGGCHVIPGIAGADGMAGPELGNVARRVHIAGVRVNTPDNLIDWIVDPPAIDPMTAMPRTGISPEEARDVAAYLYALRRR